MKKLLPVLIAFLVIIGTFFLGWHFGQNSTTKLAGELINAQMFGNDYSQILQDELLVEQIDSKRLDAAKSLIYSRLDGNILSINGQLETTNSEISVPALKILLLMESDIQSKYGSKEQRANLILARVAKYRSEHPLKYSDNSAVPNDQAIDAKIASILKNASEYQK